MPFTNAYDVPYTAGITILTVLLGFPTALATIYLTHAFVPSITLGTKQIDAGPSGPKTLTLGLLTSSDDAVLASAYISVLSSLAVASGIVLLRHLRLKKGDALIGWGVMGPAVGNFFGQVGCLVAWILMQGKSDAKVGREEDVTLVDGMYGSAGRMFTREAWACTMNSVFREKEGNWAEKACSHLKLSREITGGTTICALLILGISYWQIREHGGLKWLFGRERRRSVVPQIEKRDSLDLSV